MTFKRHERQVRGKTSSVHSFKMKQDLIANHSMVQCNNDAEGNTCKTDEDVYNEEVINGNKSISLNLKYIDNGEHIVAGYGERKNKRNVFKRAIDEDEKGPWSLISPIGTRKYIYNLKKTRCLTNIMPL